VAMTNGRLFVEPAEELDGCDHPEDRAVSAPRPPKFLRAGAWAAESEAARGQ
jgi:hypothetical protein